MAVYRKFKQHVNVAKHTGQNAVQIVNIQTKISGRKRTGNLIYVRLNLSDSFKKQPP